MKNKRIIDVICNAICVICIIYACSQLLYACSNMEFDNEAEYRLGIDVDEETE